MDFIFGSKETEKTTLLLELANKYISENSINYKNGFILLFTPPQTSDSDADLNSNLNKADNQNLKKNKSRHKNNEYKFIQHLTRYIPTAKESIDIIKGYELTSASYAFGLIDNYLFTSSKSRNLKLILIDDITTIINIWFNEIIKKKMNLAKNEEKKSIEKNFLFMYNEIFQKFLSKIVNLQKTYQTQCFITLNIDISDHINFSKYSPKIFNAIFPFIRTSYYLINSHNDEGIIFHECKLILEGKNDKIDLCIVDKGMQNENNIDYLMRKEYFEKKNKKNKKLKYEINYSKTNEWVKKGIRDFVKNINNYKIYVKKLEEQNKIEEESSCTQYA